MAAGLHEKNCDLLVDILDRLAADIGVRCRKAQREVGHLGLPALPDQVVQVFALTDNLLSFMGQCLMHGVTLNNPKHGVTLNFMGQCLMHGVASAMPAWLKQWSAGWEI